VKTIEKETRLITEQGGREVHFDLLVTSSPQYIRGEVFLMVTIMDITSQKRRRIMERVFFHDVMNTAHGLVGTLDLMEEPKSFDQIKKYIKNIPEYYQQSG
jgi:hypothetical protein